MDLLCVVISMFVSVHSTIRRSIHPCNLPIHLSNWLAISSSIHPPIHPSIFQSTNLSAQPPYPSIDPYNLPIHQCTNKLPRLPTKTYACIHPSIQLGHPSILPPLTPIHPSTHHPSTHQSTHLFNPHPCHFLIYLSTYLSIQSLICPSNPSIFQLASLLSFLPQVHQ